MTASTSTRKYRYEWFVIQCQNKLLEKSIHPFSTHPYPGETHPEGTNSTHTAEVIIEPPQPKGIRQSTKPQIVNIQNNMR